MNLGIFGFPANGTNLTNTYIPRLATYATAGTFLWQVPDGVRRIAVEVWGAGGGGYNDGGGNVAAGGGGGYAFNIVAVQPGEILTVVVGAGGANQAVVDYSVGGTSSITSAISSFTAISATGGNASGSGGAGANGALNLNGGSGYLNGGWTVFDVGPSPRSDTPARNDGTAPTGPGTGGPFSSAGAGRPGTVLIYY